MHKSYDSLHFVLFHPRGQDGWSPGAIQRLPPPLPRVHWRSRQEITADLVTENDVQDVRNLRNGNDYIEDDVNVEQERDQMITVNQRRRPRCFVTSREYATFFMHNRLPQDKVCFIYGRRLYQEWLVDQCSKEESQRLHWAQNHQQTV